jgi:2-dehydro-3-deoxyphosphogluconate aldolase / (4S)-4-hydroxy-2-oxoglutarate aldolase
MSDIFDSIRAIGIVPVIKLEKPEDARALGKALVEGGLPIAEVTFRSPAAAEGIKLMRREFPSLLVGAGTVTTPEQVAAALAAGASFAVAPGFNPRIAELFIRSGLPFVPGVNGPTEIELALEMGIRLLKFFPAEASGGVKMLKALHGPYAEVSFVPTGGIEASNLASYLALPYVAAIGGSWMVKEELLSSGNWAEVARLSAEAVALARSARDRP